MITITPANGRDYKSLGAVSTDLRAGKDFIIADMSSRWGGKPCSVHDLRAAGHADVKVRYDKLRKVAMVSLDMLG